MIAVAAVLAGVGGADAAAPKPKPMRVMSMNLCTDLLLLQLVPKSRIASISFLAHDGVDAIGRGLDAGVAINHGAAEDIAMQKPDLIFAGDFSTPMAKRLAKRVGAPVVEVKSTDSFQDIRDVTRQMAQAVGEPQRGEALIAGMDRKLAWLNAHPPRRRYTIAAWSGGSVPGKRTLPDAVIQAAGGVNIASKLDSATYNSFGIEELLRADPDVLIYGDGGMGELSLHALGPQHPLVRARWAQRTVTYPSVLFACGLPQSADAALRLRGAFDRLAAARRP